MKIRRGVRRGSNLYIALIQNAVFQTSFKKLRILQATKRKIPYFFHLFIRYVSEQVMQLASLQYSHTLP